MRTKATVGSDNRAVSDVVGYVLIFSLITISVGVITVGGFSTLQDRQDAERINNAERAFDVLAGNVEEIYRDGAPSRATEMRLSGGTLRYGEPVNVTIRDSIDHNINHSMEVTPLVYADGDTEIVYVGGAIVRAESGGSVMLREPPFVFRSNQAVLPFVRTTRTVGRNSLTQEGTIRVESIRTNLNATARSGLADASQLEIVVETPREAAWEGYLRSVASEDESWEYTSDDTLLSEPDAIDRISVPRFRILLRFLE
jgi:hypothetical protein